MGAGHLFCRCARCANRCRVRLAVDGGTVTEARRQVPGRQTAYEECPNLSKDEGMPAAELEAAGFIKR